MMGFASLYPSYTLASLNLMAVTRHGTPTPSVGNESRRIRDAGASGLAPTQSAWEPEKDSLHQV